MTQSHFSAKLIFVPEIEFLCTNAATTFYLFGCILTQFYAEKLYSKICLFQKCFFPIFSFFLQKMLVSKLL